MAEEHGFQAPEGHRLCANGCGFFGSPATLDLCSKCYRDYRMKEEQAKSAKSAVENSLLADPASAEEQPASVLLPSSSPFQAPAVKEEEEVKAAAALPVVAQLQSNRCHACKKRVGLTGFKCRCGITFCGPHRYPEQHGCAFDYKAVGREAIARDNPVVKGAKLEKI